MPQTKAEIRKEWDKNNMTRIQVILSNKRDAELIEWLKQQPNKSDAIRRALRLAVEAEKVGTTDAPEPARADSN